MHKPKITARAAGIAMSIMIAGGVFAQGFVANKLISFSDAALTANNILANRSLFQLSFTVFLVEMASQIAVTALLYRLLSPVNRDIALVAAFIDLGASIMKTFSRAFYIMPLFVLSGSNALSAFSADQLRALALVLLKINDRGAATACAFFAVSGLLNGYLIFRSGFLPRGLGILAMISAAGWARFFYPSLRFPPFMVVAVTSLVVVCVQIFWFVVFGVDEEKWRERERLTR